MQHAIPTVLGLQFAGWADALDRHAQRLRDTRRRAAVLQFGGAAGTLAPFGDRGLAVGAAIAATLGLELPRLSWHAHRDRIAEVATTLALLAGTLGKIARDIAIQSQTELAELEEPSELGRGGSSSMPHKRNPVSSAVALAAAVRIPGLAAGILAGMVQEHERGLGGWQAEWESVPELVCLCAGSLHHVRHTVDGLIVNAARMQANLEASRGLIYSEAVTMALAKHIGRADARTLVERAAGRAAAEGRQLREVLQSDAAVTTHLTGGDLARLFDPQAQLGVSHELIDRVVHSPDRKRVRHETSSAARFVEVGGHRTRYEVVGPVDGPVLVLSNSLGANLAMWDPQVAALAGRWRIVRYDTRGHGGSSVTPGPYSIAQLADDVISLLDHLGVEQADWCGLSMGGMIGLRLAVDHPERVGKLVICSSAAQIGTPASWADRITAVRRGGTEAIVGSVMTRWFSDGFRARDPDTVERIARQFVATSADGYAACCAAIRDADLRDVVGTIRAPTLVVAATEDPVISTEAVRWLADHIPGARYGELPTAHLSNVEDSVAFTSLVSHFLSA
jgi:3-oxoadipate enol-lactonase